VLTPHRATAVAKIAVDAKERFMLSPENTEARGRLLNNEARASIINMEDFSRNVSPGASYARNSSPVAPCPPAAES